MAGRCWSGESGCIGSIGLVRWVILSLGRTVGPTQVPGSCGRDDTDGFGISFGQAGKAEVGSDYQADPKSVCFCSPDKK